MYFYENESKSIIIPLLVIATAGRDPFILYIFSLLYIVYTVYSLYGNLLLSLYQNAYLFICRNLVCKNLAMKWIKYT